MTTHKVHVRNLRVGDVILLDSGNYKVRITSIALVRGLEIEFKYRSADWRNRSATEHRVVLSKHAILTVDT